MPSFSAEEASSSDKNSSDCSAKNHIDACLALLRREKIRCVALDMDCTAVAQHSRGRLRRGKPLEAFLSRATPAFVALVPALHRHGGFCIAVTTHSDEAEFEDTSKRADDGSSRIHRDTHILGEELVTALLERYFTPEIVRDVCIVAYNPRVRRGGMTDDDERNKIKRYHMRQLQEHPWSGGGGQRPLQPSEIVLWDDTDAVVRDCREHCGVRAVQVLDPDKGLQWSDVMRLGTDQETKRSTVSTSLSSSDDRS